MSARLQSDLENTLRQCAGKANMCANLAGATPAKLSLVSDQLDKLADSLQVARDLLAELQRLQSNLCRCGDAYSEHRQGICLARRDNGDRCRCARYFNAEHKP